ncbi:HEAT repeat domain-containing protein [Leptolyngbya sp. NK1-12]|uniref:HEAT repeat domain-containing protein n=1 Tax=Leptolyngbya sp. NK1-12 TaxID=2547451 RepID=A0AA97ALT7_9CYAN|nr:HEAT repeat domain-containing protein [Leptolyngbya sp. NK1-12]WNZ26872.1 HEAT repeat domain-containing protein [Leptolyngbya sp. NK1-12]WNZ27916.1 HEAT repeat domain-containing protein [Leptolyngbya sp. NK1-12]
MPEQPFDHDTNEAISSDSLTVEQAIANLQGEDLGLRVYAAWWLGRFRVDEPLAIDILITALDDEADRTEAGGYPLRRNAARALGKLGDRRAVPALIQALSCSDFYVREAAAQSLELLGDPSGIPALLALLQDQIPGTLPAPEPPYLVQPYDAILEALGTLQAGAAVPLIVPFLQHEIPRIQYAAARALYQLTPDPREASQYGDRLVAALAGDELQLRRAALADLGAIGYLAAAEPIAQTLAENSLKLIALKGLLETQIQQRQPPGLNEGAIRVMALMDELL